MPTVCNLRLPLQVATLCACLAGVALWGTPARSQDAAETKRDDAQAVPPAAALQFNFERQPWRGVLDWLALEADLALHIGDLPTGSFTYADARSYTPDEAIHRINLFLIPQRYALVRSGKMLSVVNLDDSNSVRQLDAMAETVDTAALSELGSHHLVKCLFPLGNVAPEQALEELNELMLIREPVVLRNTNQLLVTDTAGKLRMVQKILAGVSDPDAAIGPVKYFPLGTLDGERVLAQIRPHVGLDPLAMMGADIRLSIDLDGGQVLASGSQENLDAVAGVMKMLQASAEAEVVRPQLEFRTHDVGEADMQTVVNVLQTLLADEDVRMAPDTKSNQLAILGVAEVHEVITKTITDLAGRADKVEFKALDVPVDPRYAVMVLNEMFAPLEATDDDEDNAIQIDAPKMSADPFSGRIFVRAKGSQIAEIEKAVLQLGQPDLARDPTLRMLPFRGERARQIINSSKEFWPHADELQVLPAADGTHPQPLEREVNPEPAVRPAAPRDSAVPSSFSNSKLENRVPGVASLALVPTSLANRLQPETSADARQRSRIRVQQTPRGILVHSDDPAALQRFEEHVQLIAGPDDSAQRLAIFYLKHATSDDANRLLQRLLEAEEFATPIAQALGGGGMLRSIVDVMGADSLGRMWTVGTATIVPDKRLNRLFVYGSVAELTNIEKHLQVIDRENSIAQVATHGTPRVIQLHYAKAESVAAVVRDAYAGRIAANTQQREQAAQQSQRQQQASPQNQRQQQQDAQSGNAAGNQRIGQSSRQASAAEADGQPQLTLAADAQSNSLVITAPEQLAEEVESLVRILDQQGAQAAHVITLNESSPQHVHDALRRLLGDQLRAGSSPTPSRSNNSRSR